MMIKLHTFKRYYYALFFTLVSVFGWGQVTIFSENMYNGTGGATGDAIATHETNNRFNEDGLTYSGTGDMRTSNPSLGYTGFSGTWNVMLNATGETFIIDGINASSYSSLSLSFGVGKAANAPNGSTLIVEYSTTGTTGTYTTISWPVLATGTGTSYATTYYLRTSTTSIPSNVTTIRFRTTSTDEYRIDDVKLTGVVSSFTMTYNGNSNDGGTAPIDSSSPYVSGATVTVLGNTGTLTKTGYTFGGWNTLANGTGTDRTPASTFTINANTTLHAKWTPNNNTITFDGNGSDGGSMATQTIATAASANLNANGFTKTGYTFAGWATTAGGGVVYTDGASYTMGTSNVTLYARWNINSYNVVYNGNTNDGGTAPATQNGNYNTTVTLSGAGTLTKTGYTFNGWNTAADGSGTSYNAGDTFTIPANNVNLFAKWLSAGVVSVKSGSWNDATVWNTGTVPNSTDQVTIMPSHTVYTNASITRSASTTVNGSFQLDAGGWATGSNFTYGSAGTLIFNNTSSYGVNNGDVFWPITNGPVNVTILQGGLTLNSANRTVTGLFQTAAGVTLSSSTLTLSGAAQINAGGFFNQSPTYTNTSTLIYNGVTGFGVSSEWTGNSTSAGNGVPQNVTLVNSSVNLPNSNRGLAGNLTIGTSSTLNLNGTSGDLYIAGNWSDSGTFNANGRAVFFNGASTQTITNASGETYSYLIHNGSGLLQFNNNITINGNSGDVLQLLAGTIDLNGKNLTLSGTGGNIKITGSQILDSSISGSVLNITNGLKTVTNGNLTIPSNVTTVLNNGINFGNNLTTIQGILRIATGGYVQTNAPIYTNTSTLEYNGVTGFGVTSEWTGNSTTAGNGVPQNVTLVNSSVNLPNSNRGLAGNLTIGTSSTLNLNGTSGDLYIAGNWSDSGTFNANGRAVFFNGASTQTVTNASGETYSYLIHNGSGLLQFNNNITVNGNSGDVLQLLAGTIDLNGKNLTLSGTGGNIKITGSQILDSSISGSVLNITNGLKTVTSGNLTIPSNVTTVLNNGINFGNNLTTIQGILRIATGGYVQTNAPIYTNTSTLEYNGVTGFGVTSEWTGSATTVGAGVPNNVVLTSNASINMPDVINSPRSASTITIGSGSTLVQGATQNYADLIVFGAGAAWTNNGTLTPSNRTVIFQGSAAQTINGTSGNFGNLKINSAAGVTPNLNITINNSLDFSNGKLYLGNYNVTTGSTINSTSSSYAVTAGTGRLIQSVASADVFYPVGFSDTNYTPIKIKNTSGTSNISALVKQSITNAVYDNTKVVTLEWNLNSSAATTATITPTWVASKPINEATNFINTTTGEVGNYTTSYVLYPVTLATSTTTATGVSLVNGTNLIVVGNTNAILPAVPVVTPANLTGTYNASFTYNVIATNSPTSYALASGTLPPGLSLNTATGVITGTPTAAGSYTVTITASNTGGTSAPATFNFTINKADPVFSPTTITISVGGTATITSTSTGAMSFSSANTAIATVGAGTGLVTGVAAGTTTISVTQAADSNYNAVTTAVSIPVTVSSYNVNDYRTINGTGLSWGTLAHWETFDGTNWIAAPTLPSSVRTVYILGNMTTGGSRNINKIIIESGGVLTVSASSTSTTQLLVKTGGVLQINAALTNNGTFEIEDNATVYFNYPSYSASGLSTTLWAGTENFRPNSNFVIQAQASSTSDFFIPSNTDITANAYNGFTACFGNLIFDSSGTATYVFLGGNFSKNITHNDFIFRSNTSTTNAFRFTAGTTMATTVGGNFTMESTFNRNINLFATSNPTINLTINGNLTNSSSKKINLSNANSSTINVNGNIIGNGNGSIDLNSGTTGSCLVNLLGDLTVNSTSGILSTSISSSVFNFTGTGNGLTDATTQTIDVANATTASNITFNTNSGSYVKLINQDFALGTNSAFNVKSGATLDFGFNGGNTALNLTRVSGQINQSFSAASGSILKITSPLGIVAGGTSYTGNVAIGSDATTSRIFDVGANYHYIGKANQVSGNGVPSNLTNKIIVELDTDALMLQPSGSISFNGGTLEIRKGIALDNTSGSFNNGSSFGNLTMNGGRLQLSRIGTQPTITGTYTLTGGVVEFANSGSGQTIRNAAPIMYQNIEVTGNNVGNSSSNLTLNANGTFTVKNGGVFSMNSDGIVGPTGTQTVTVENGGTFKTGDADGFSGSAQTSIQPSIENIVLADGSTVEYTRTDVQTITEFNALPANPTVSDYATKGYYNLKISGDNTTGSTAKVLDSKAYARNNFEVVSPAIFKIEDSKTLTVYNTLYSAGENNFSVENDGNLIQVNNTPTVSNTGNVKVKRYTTNNLNRLDYVYWSAPVSGQVFQLFSPNTVARRFYTYNEGTDFFDTVPNVSTATFTPGVGYAIRVPDNYTSVNNQQYQGSFVGVPNNGTSVTTAVTKNGNGYNLVGNPYPSNLELDGLTGFYETNKLLINKKFYFWTNHENNPTSLGSSYSGANYAIWNGSGSVAPGYGNPDTLAPTSSVKVGQGFIVEAKQAGSLIFNNSMRNAATSNFVSRIKYDQKDRFWLSLITPANNSYNNLIAYVEGATDNLDRDFDAEKLEAPSDDFYSVLGTNKLTIQGRKYPLSSSDVVALGTKLATAGTYKIALTKTEGIFATGQEIYLHDKLLNTYTNLQNESYTFDVSQQGEINNRFEITYQPESTLDVSNLEKEKVRIYYQEKDIVIEAYKTINEILVYDVSGKLIKSIKPKTKQLLIENSVLSNGVNVISIIFANEKINAKVISR